MMAMSTAVTAGNQFSYSTLWWWHYERDYVCVWEKDEERGKRQRMCDRHPLFQKVTQGVNSNTLYH